MEVKYNVRNFQYIELPEGETLQQSSAIGDYEDSLENPGSSFLWIGDEHCDREAVKDYLDDGFFSKNLEPHIEAWLTTGSLELT